MHRILNHKHRKMELLDQIIALLEAKFQGVRKDALQNLAGVIALQVEDKAGAQSIVDHLTADKVNQFTTSYRSRIDKEVQQSNQAYENNLRKKYDFTEKKDPTKQEPKPGDLTLEAIQSAIASQLAPLTQRMDAYDVAKAGAARRDAYVGKMKEAKISEAMQTTLLQQFDRMTFKDDADFNQFLADSASTLAKMAQDESNARLRSDHIPSMGNADDKGVSSAMKDYIASKAQNGGQVEGKSL